MQEFTWELELELAVMGLVVISYVAKGLKILTLLLTHTGIESYEKTFLVLIFAVLGCN